MKKIRLSLILTLTVVVIASIGYLFYVRGVAIAPHLEGPKSIKQDGKTFVYEWKIKKEMPTPRTEVTAGVLDNKIYVIGGFDGFGRTSNVVEVYDTVNDTWSKGPVLPEGRHHSAAISVENKLYVIGGFIGNFEPKGDVFLLDLDIPTSAAWQKKSPLPTPRGALAASNINGKIYVVAGVGKGGLSNTLEVYDTEIDKWQKKKNAPTKREHLAVGSLNGLLYVGGGRNKSLSENISTLEIYNPLTDTWSKGKPLPTARGGVVGVSFNGLFVVAGGESPTGTYKEVEGYDPNNEVWIVLPHLPTARHGLSAAVVNDSLYVIGGGKNPGLSVSGNNEVLEFRLQDQ